MLSVVFFCKCIGVFYFFFFFQAEDGIRDLYVTGVQTCALPIFCGRPLARPRAATHTKAAAAGERLTRRSVTAADAMLRVMTRASVPDALLSSGGGRIAEV